MRLRPGADAWLSLTPEPERDLPVAIAALRAEGEPSPDQIAHERARAEALVLRGNRRRWVAWLREATELADSREERDPRVTAARELVLDVIDNHDALELGLPGRRPLRNGAEGETFERVRTRNEKGTAR
ncbi:MAG: hypothetical protein FJW90_05335 [Actinobacteria bacterium]|nr:hypothetical protein [Actinomycetota bacterium]